MRSAPRRLRFRPDRLPLIGGLAFVTLVASLSVLAHRAVLGPDPTAYPDHLVAVLTLPFSTVIVLGTWGLLRYEGVSPAAVGLSWARLGAGAAAFGLLWGWVSVAGTGYLFLTGATDALGVAIAMPWYWIPIWFVLMLTLSNGLPEEFLFRGYVQNKCTALAPRDSRVPRAAVGILAAAVLFGVAHLPRALLLAGAGLPAVPWVILNNLLPGLTFGCIYYLTRNVWYTGFVHGFGNATLVPFDPAAVPLFVPFVATSAILVGIGYRYRRPAARATVVVQRRFAAE